MAFTKLRSVCKQRTHKEFLDSDYESWGIINEKGELTNAGALIADESPVRQSRVFCTRWNGLNKAPGLIDPAVKKKILNGKEVVTISHRPADDIAPEFEALKEKYKDLCKSDEDVLSCALFENIAVKFLEKRNATPNENVEIEEFNLYIG